MVSGKAQDRGPARIRAQPGPGPQPDEASEQPEKQEKPDKIKEHIVKHMVLSIFVRLFRLFRLFRLLRALVGLGPWAKLGPDSS